MFIRQSTLVITAYLPGRVMCSGRRVGCDDSGGRGVARWWRAGYLAGGHRGRGGRPRGAPAPLRALRAARGARGPRRRAPPRGRAARYCPATIHTLPRHITPHHTTTHCTTTYYPCCPRDPWAAPVCTAPGTSCSVLHRNHTHHIISHRTTSHHTTLHHYVSSVLPEGHVHYYNPNTILHEILFRV